MSRRKSQKELDIGSDSFLDVIANMVGILIILIVLAGLAVKDIPLTSLLATRQIPETVAHPVTTEASVVAPQITLTEEPADDVAVAVIPHIAPPMPTASASIEIEKNTANDVAELERTRIEELAKQSARLRAELERMDAMTAKRRNELDLSRSQIDELERQKRELRIQVQETIDALKQARDRDLAARTRLDRAKGDYLNLQAQLDAEKKSRPAANAIEHTLSAVSHEVQGEEWHFQIDGNRVAYVPIKELLEDVQSAIKTRKELLVKYPRYHGEVGPIEGYALQYTIERQALSIVDELRYGQGIMRIGLAEWRIDPEPGFKGETLEQALKPRSKFHNRLRVIGSGRTLTFWVYPDGFDTFRQLQSLAREQGYIVAGRPLPRGVPISGSPQGTRSAGQ